MKMRNLVTIGLGALIMTGTTTAFIEHNYLTKNPKPRIENVSEYNQFKKNKALLYTGIVATVLGVSSLALWGIEEVSESKRGTYRLK